VAHLLGAQDVSLEYPTRKVFEAVSVALSEGDRVGVVGRNGHGKSTLLRILAGQITPDSGQVVARNGLQIGYVDQSDVLDDSLTVRQIVLGDREEHEWASDATIRDILSGTLADVPLDRSVAELSGGQRRRVSLARTLIERWDVLFLDEPTNHLDLAGVTWLAQHLTTRWPKGQGVLVVVTHDRWFLDAVTTTTWEVHHGRIDRYEGGYAAYVLARLERERQAQASWDKSQNLLRKELAWLRRGAPARTSKPKFRIDRAEALIEGVGPLRDEVSLKTVAMSRLGKTVLEADNLTVGYGERPVLNHLTWGIGPGDRIGILGRNGEGKSTLLATLAGILEPQSGSIKRGKTVKLAILDQRDEGLKPWWNDRVSKLVADHKTSYQAADGEVTPGELIERLGFAKEELPQFVSTLSGGQRRRLQLLVHLLAEPNVLLLDEPTNDLDTDMLTALEDLLDTWPGSLIVVSHDRYLLERVTDAQFALRDGTLVHLPGGLDQYLRELPPLGAVNSSPRTTAAIESGATNPGSSDQVLLRPGSAEHRELTKARSGLERKMETLEKKKSEILQQMLATDQSDFQALQPLSEALRDVEGQLADSEATWLEWSEKLGD
jgi:ABC transport system ATP-binding/permease protein